MGVDILINTLQNRVTGQELLKVRVRAIPSRKGGRTYKTLYIVIPSDVAKLLNIKEGDELNMTITDIEVEGTKRKALIYYK